MDSFPLIEILLIALATFAVVWSVTRVNAVEAAFTQKERNDEKAIRYLLNECVLCYMVIGDTQPFESMRDFYFLPFSAEIETAEGRFCGVAAANRSKELFVVSDQKQLVYSDDLDIVTLMDVRRKVVEIVSRQIKQAEPRQTEATS